MRPANMLFSMLLYQQFFPLCVSSILVCTNSVVQSHVSSLWPWLGSLNTCACSLHRSAQFLCPLESVYLTHTSSSGPLLCSVFLSIGFFNGRLSNLVMEVVLWLQRQPLWMWSWISYLDGLVWSQSHGLDLSSDSQSSSAFTQFEKHQFFRLSLLYSSALNPWQYKKNHSLDSAFYRRMISLLF